MLIGIVAKLRNGALLKYRELYGLSQPQAARLAGVSAGSWNAVECMRFKDATLGVVTAIAATIDATVEDIFPQEVRHLNLGLERSIFREQEVQMLCARKAFYLPDETGEVDPAVGADIIRSVLKSLTFLEREVLKKRFGIDGPSLTLAEIGKHFGATVERVRMLEAKALRKLADGPRRKMLESLRNG